MKHSIWLCYDITRLLYANVVVFVIGCFYFLVTGCGRCSCLSFTGGWFSGESLPWLNKRLWMWPNRKKCDVTLPWKKFLDLKDVSKQRLGVNFFFFFFLSARYICMATVCWHAEILLPWQRDVTASPLYSSHLDILLFLSQQVYFQNSLNTTIFQKRLEWGKRKRVSNPVIPS